MRVFKPGRTLILAIGAAVFLTAFLACADNKAEAPDGSGSEGVVAARIGDGTITYQELDEYVKKTNSRAYQAFFDARNSALQGLVQERLMEAEASSRGMTVDALRQSVLNDAANVSDADIEAFFNQNQARMGGRTLEQMSGQLRTYLETSGRTNAMRNFVAELKKKTSVEVLLEIPRVEVAVNDNAPSMGPPGAPVTVLEFSDFQ